MKLVRIAGNEIVNVPDEKTVSLKGLVEASELSVFDEETF